MSASALEAAGLEIEIVLPGGGGPGDLGPHDPGSGGGGGDDNGGRFPKPYLLGLTLALVSITALFVAVVMVYYLRSRMSLFWEPIHLPPALWLSTGILILSSLMIELARRALAGRQWFAYRRRLFVTSLLGFSFIAAQLIALAGLVRHGYYLRSNPHASVFYVFTGLHGAHLAVGMAVLIYLLAGHGRDWLRHRIVSNLVAIYWHFMAAVWIGLLAVLISI